jgi:hypothetical protein|tara:strand:- start:989 stop:1738 length:750 start_codon:yes stop_codon:yes gene_type:complete
MSKNIVFIVNLPESKKQGRSQPYQYAVDSWSTWCDNNNCELFVLTERIYPESYMNANWHKLFIFQLLEANKIDYDQILIVDADTIIHPKAPNIFELTDNKFCAVHNFGSYDWVCRSIENYKKHLFPKVDIPLFEYFNSGVIICNKSHKEFYQKIINYYLDNQKNITTLQNTYHVGTDQPILNFFIQKDKIDYKQLGYEWNMQNMQRFEILDNELTFTKIGWIYHFNGIPDDTRNYIMNKTNKYLKTLMI